jgi:uncharacterized membrane protein
MEKDRLAVGREYIERARTRGKSDQDIREALLRAGWTQADLETLLRSIPTPVDAAPEPGPPHEAPADPVSFVRTEIQRWRAEGLVSGRLAERLLAEYDAGPPPAPAAPDEDAWPSVRIPMTAGMVLLYIGGLLIVIAAIMVTTHVWEDLGPGGRFTLLLLPTLGLYGAGAYLHVIDASRRVVSSIMLFFACLLVPFTLLLGATFLIGETHLEDATWLLLSFATLGIHVATLYFFRSPVLSIPYPLSFLWAAIHTVSLAAPGRYGPDAAVIETTITLSGLILLAVGAAHAWQRKPGYAVMPDLVGSFCFLVGLVALGADGHHPGWEFLALVASVGLIAASVYRRNQTYLLVGSLFLTVNIFWIGFEYFGKTMGLPVTLLMCGALSMAVGYVVHRLRKEHIVLPRRPSAAVASGSGRRR